MNKQEALEAVLARVRGWEETNAEVRAKLPEEVGGVLLEAARTIDMISASGEDESKRMPELLVAVAAAAVYLLVDEVVIVEPPVVPLTAIEKGVRVNPSPSSYEPMAVNGTMVEMWVEHA